MRRTPHPASTLCRPRRHTPHCITWEQGILGEGQTEAEQASDGARSKLTSRQREEREEAKKTRAAPLYRITHFF
jgi:hypothetical protein